MSAHSYWNDRRSRRVLEFFRVCKSSLSLLKGKYKVYFALVKLIGAEIVLSR